MIRIDKSFTSWVMILFNQITLKSFPSTFNYNLVYYFVFTENYCNYLFLFQACSSQARKLGMAPIAAENEIVHTFIRCICGAPLLPGDLIDVGVEEIWVEVEASGWGQLLGPFFEYYRRYWFPRIAELSVFGIPERTNNASECDNHALGNVLPQNRPNIWKVVSEYHVHQSNFSINLSSIVSLRSLVVLKQQSNLSVF